MSKKNKEEYQIIGNIGYGAILLLSTGCIVVIVWLIAITLQDYSSLFRYLSDGPLFDLSNPIFWRIVICIFLALMTKVLYNARIKIRHITDFNRHGRSKRYESYDKLSAKEKAKIDEQKLMDAERILDTNRLRKMTHKGSSNPDKAMDKLVGLKDVKQTMKEMAARMEYEQHHKRKKDDELSMHMCFLGPPGTGKAQPLYSKVLTPSGFVDMGSVKVGDKVISASGKTSNVIGVFPQGLKPVYEITFNDGSSVRCSDEHLWKVQNKSDRQNKVKGKKRKQTYRIMSLKDMIPDIHCSDGRSNYSVDYINAINYSHKKLPIDPYLMGILLGDGCFPCNNKDSVKISLPDADIKSRVKNLLKNYNTKLNKITKEKCDYRVVTTNPPYNEIRTTLKKLGLIGLHSYEKFIPKIYLTASKKQRLELLRGLLDSDGYTVHNSIEFSTTSEKIKDDIIDLVRSLGGYASFSTRMGKYKKDGTTITTRINYRVYIFFFKEDPCPFWLKRKASLYNPVRSKKDVKRYIKNVTYIGEEECQCILIDDPSHLYITNNYTITHNTTCARIMAGYLYKYKFIKKNKCIEVDGNFLKGVNPGETATKVELIIEQALGGVLFIDEAYSLLSGNLGSGEEAVASIVKSMEDNRGDIVIILAGYEKEMKDLINSNPGIFSRIKYYMWFGNYSDEDLRTIFTKMANSKGFCVSADALDRFSQKMHLESKKKNFGNARTVRNALEKAIDKHSYNIVSGVLDKSKTYMIEAEDIDMSSKAEEIFNQ